MVYHVILLALLFSISHSRIYPLYKQCDPRWKIEKLGTSSKNICDYGCAISSVAMALSGTGHNYNPSTLNTWVKENRGFLYDYYLIWPSVNPLGIKYMGVVSRSNIASSLSAGHIVILNVRKGLHWVLATSMSGNTIYVNDPYYSNTSYSLYDVE